MEIQLTAEGDKLIKSIPRAWESGERTQFMPMGIGCLRYIGHHHLNPDWKITATRNEETITLRCKEVCLEVVINGLFDTYALLENLFSRQQFMRPTRRGMDDDGFAEMETEKDKKLKGQPANNFWLSKNQRNHLVRLSNGITKDAPISDNIGKIYKIGTVNILSNDTVFTVRMKAGAATVVFCPVLGIRAMTYVRTFRTIGDKGNITVVDDPLPVLT